MDEQQDMTPILKRFTDKVIRDRNAALKKRPGTKSGRNLRIVVLGDRRQEVYGFNNADSRFLTMASRPEVFGYVNEHGWTSAEQTTSNRVTQQNVDFINQQMLKRPLGSAMRAVRTHDELGNAFPKPRYIICDPYEDILDEVLRLIESCKVLPADIIVLAPSVRGISPAIYLANALALRGIPVFRSDSDVSDISPEVARGKVLICTYHQAKGIERRACIVMGFDATYHTWYDKMVQPPSATSNPQYVAATRALDHLVLIHDHKSAPLPYVDLKSVSNSCDLVAVRPLEPVEPAEPGGSAKSGSFNVTSLCRNLSETLITACLKKLEVRSLAPPGYSLQPPITTEIDDKYGLRENVSAITGTAVPAIYQWHHTRRLDILPGSLKLLRLQKRRTARPNPLRQLPREFYEKLKKVEKAHSIGNLTTDDILFLSAIEMATKDKDITKLLAIPLDGGYSWIPDVHSRDIHFKLNSLPDPAQIPNWGVVFECFQGRKLDKITSGGGPINPNKIEGVLLQGAMDIFRPDTRNNCENRAVWEVKYTQSLQPEHVLQVALYMLMLSEQRLASGFLVSARTGQTVQVLPRTPTALMEILQLLVDSKSGGPQSRLLNKYSDEEFLECARRNFDDLVDRCALPAWFAMKPTGSKRRQAGSSQEGKMRN